MTDESTRDADGGTNHSVGAPVDTDTSEGTTADTDADTANTDTTDADADTDHTDGSAPIVTRSTPDYTRRQKILSPKVSGGRIGHSLVSSEICVVSMIRSSAFSSARSSSLGAESRLYTVSASPPRASRPLNIPAMLTS